MKATKIALAAAAVIAGSTLYGNHRFEVSRYEPQCDHLPGVCVYGTEKPNLVSSYVDESDMPVRRLETHGSTVSVTYRDHNSFPKLVSTRPSYDFTSSRVSCEVHGPVQILSNGLVKGCNGDWQDSRFYLASLYGLREIFATPKPSSQECKPWKSDETPYFCSKEGAYITAPQKKVRRHATKPAINPSDQARGEFCETIYQLRKLSQSIGGDSGCLIGIVRAMAVEGPYLSDKSDSWFHDTAVRSKALVSYISSPVKTPTAPDPFWKGWDYVFGAGIISVLGLAISSLFKKKKLAVEKQSTPQKTEKDVKPELVLPELDRFILRYPNLRQANVQPKTKKTGDKMDDKEKKRKELEKMFDTKMEEFFRGVDKAKTHEEVRTIWREFLKFDKAIKKEDFEFYKTKEFQEETMRFEDCISGKFGSTRIKWH